MADECSCGRFYADQTGVNLCTRNQHGDGKDHFEKHQFRNTIEPEITAVCADCHRSLRAYLRINGYDIEVNVLPHVCEVEAPMEGATNE